MWGSEVSLVSSELAFVMEFLANLVGHANKKRT
jgi:hypothetical protein